MNEESKDKIILYRTEDGLDQIQLRQSEGTVWLSQAEMAELFQTTKQNVSLHIQNVFDEKELSQEATVKEYLTVQSEGNRQVERSIILYRLEVILAVGYRVRSPRGAQFRRWATTVLSEYLVKGFALDDQRLKSSGQFDYFDELLARIREIRVSEKRFYQKIRDLFAATSVDYDTHSGVAQTFFKTIQNKLIYAVTGKTAAELIIDRADPEKPNMALTSWMGSKVWKTDIAISKNYLNEDEIDLLNRLTTMFLDFAEMRAKEQQTITMNEWNVQADEFLTFNCKRVLKNSGTISHKRMEKIVGNRFNIFEENRKSAETRSAEIEYEQDMKQLENEAKKLISKRKSKKNEKNK